MLDIQVPCVMWWLTSWMSKLSLVSCILTGKSVRQLVPLRKKKEFKDKSCETVITWISGQVVNVLDCNIILSSNSSHAITFTFKLIPWGKAWTPLSFYVGLQHHSEWVQTPVMLLHSLSDQYPWERHEPSYPSMLDCNIIVSEFKLLLCYCIHLQTNTLGKGVNSFPPCYKVK